MVSETQLWMERCIVGLNLCPFAKGPLGDGRVRLALSDATDSDAVVLPFHDSTKYLSIYEYFLSDYFGSSCDEFALASREVTISTIQSS